MGGWVLLITVLLISSPALACDDNRIFEGLRLFTEETFGGNGRVCATCHPPTHNFTIDPAYINNLPANDPLFVAEFNPKLQKLERPELLREYALVRVNVDGFGNRGVSRGVPHLLGLSQTIRPGQAPFSSTHMTGWSGDGSPGDGSLHSFAVGAVRQHFTRSMERRGCATDNYDPDRCDFRIPTIQERGVLQDFQLFLGRHKEINIEPYSSNPREIVFSDPNVEQGKMLFHAINGGANLACSTCHFNAGANDENGSGTLFDVGANKDPRAPACLEPGRVPGDGGFGRNIETTVNGQEMCGTTIDFNVVFRGDNRFNTPSIIEAADTPPFFHNNIVNTIEDAVSFYRTPQFARSEMGAGLPFRFLDYEVNEIAAMLRTLNALDNMDNSDRFDQLALRGITTHPDLARYVVKIAASETEDAIQVLTGGPLHIFPSTNIVTLLRKALTAEQQAINTWDGALLTRAIFLRKQARNQLITYRE